MARIRRKFFMCSDARRGGSGPEVVVVDLVGKRGIRAACPTQNHHAPTCVLLFFTFTLSVSRTSRKQLRTHWTRARVRSLNVTYCHRHFPPPRFTLSHMQWCTVLLLLCPCQLSYTVGVHAIHDCQCACWPLPCQSTPLHTSCWVHSRNTDLCRP
jgi:hypothetical protein